MKLKWFSEKFIHNWYMCLIGVLCVSYFGDNAGFYIIIPSVIFGWAFDTKSARNYWFHGNKGDK